jgi:hypothetical protein
MALAENTVRMELLMKDNIIMDLSTAKGLWESLMAPAILEILLMDNSKEKLVF